MCEACSAAGCTGAAELPETGSADVRDVEERVDLAGEGCLAFGRVLVEAPWRWNRGREGPGASSADTSSSSIGVVDSIGLPGTITVVIMFLPKASVSGVTARGVTVSFSSCSS
jgi:hypothetical protein